MLAVHILYDYLFIYRYFNQLIRRTAAVVLTLVRDSVLVGVVMELWVHIMCKVFYRINQ